MIDRPALGLGADQPPCRILLLYGSLRQRSFSLLRVEEAAPLLQLFGAETRIFGLPTCVCRIRLPTTAVSIDEVRIELPPATGTSLATWTIDRAGSAASAATQ